MGELFHLDEGNLPRLSNGVLLPRYDRNLTNQSIVHIGVGGFHRAHQAMYLDALLADPETERWGECGVGLLEGDRRMRDALLGQDCLYTLVERSPVGEKARVIGSMRDYLFAPDAREAVLARLASAETKIVSLTITEGGYFLDAATGDINLDHRDIQYDLEHPHEPITCVGFIVEALDRRMRAGLAPFTVMSCDNLQSNGEVTRRLVDAFSGLRDSALQHRLAKSVCFPNSMVDRITPGTTPQDVTFVQERFGLNDAWPVMTEPYTQWVLEDEFSAGRPQWERAGVELVTDVMPYELMKIRLLNGSHLAMAYLGALAAYEFVHEVMQDELFLAFIRRFMDEVTPIVPKILNVSLPQYKETLMERFANPAIRDQVTRICSEGSAKLPKWILPSLVELLKRQERTTLLCVVLASWIYYLGRDVDEKGQALAIVDARGLELSAIARAGGLDPSSLLSVSSIFGTELQHYPATLAKIGEAMQILSQRGARGTIKHFLSANG
jgi:mannitol 2-dehydrogenase